MTETQNAADADGVAFPPARLIETAGGPFDCIDAGAGPAFMALHGGMGGRDQSWLLARALLGEAPSRRVLALSRPGYLGTPLAVGRAPEQQADALAGLLDALDLSSATVAAVSAGGPAALAFAARHPRRCKALILVSACTGRLETPPMVRSGLRLMRFLARFGFLARRMRDRTVRDPEAAAARAIADPELRHRTMAHPQAGTLLRALQVGVHDRLRDRLPGTLNDTTLFQALPERPSERIAAPTLVIHGDADRIVPFSHAEAVAEIRESGELMRIEGGEHVALFTHLDPIRERVGAFLTRVEHAPEGR